MNSLSQEINESENEPQANRVWFDDETASINAELTDGRIISVPLSFYPLLALAKKEQRENFELFGNGTIIRFISLDECLPIEALISGRKQICIPSKESA